jgi:c-di-GMP-binding flagellar brake protein YcgR
MRHFDRRPAELPVVVRAARQQGPGGIRLDSANLSEGGAFLRSDLLFEIGEALIVEIPLPSGSVVRAAARVVRVARDKNPAAVPGMGIEFTGLSSQDRRLIQEGTHG